MATFEQYETKKGKFWKFQTYLGINPATGKPDKTTRRGFTTKKEAQLELRRLQLDYEQNGLEKRRSYTYEEIYLEWFDQYKNTVKESTYVKTQRIFKNHILPSLGNLKIDKIQLKHCQKAVNDWAKMVYRYKMLVNYASSVFEYGMRIQLIDKNPMKLITKPKIKEKEETEPNFYTKEQLELFFEALEKENNKMVLALFRVLAFLGCRKGEALALTWDDIDFDNKQVIINKTLTHGEGSRLIIQTPKTKDSKRIISVDETTLQILKTWRLSQRKNSLMYGHNTIGKNQIIFNNPNNDYIHPSRTTYYMDKICKKYNLKRITTHGFRHTHCSLLFEAGASIKEVQDRLGHSDIQTTMNIYAHVTQERKEKTAEKFANYVAF